jgi:hypothetical protein
MVLENLTSATGFCKPMQYNWIPTARSSGGGGVAAPIDQHCAFRINFTTTASTTEVLIKHTGVSWYELCVDGARCAEGPTRFVHDTPYFDVTRATLNGAGAHTVAVHAHSAGVQTRILLTTAPAVAVEVMAVDAASAPISAPTWRCTSLAAFYKPQWRRLSSLLGWCEHCTVESELLAWREVGFDDSKWSAPVPGGAGLQPPVPLADVAGPATSVPGSLKLLAHGDLAERFGYADDDPPARLSLRDLAPDAALYGAAQGRWWRYDAGHCRLLRPVIACTLPAGAVVEVVFCQARAMRSCTGA